MVRFLRSKSRAFTAKESAFYLLLTYGSRHGGEAELAQGMLKEFGIYPSYINVVLMADNFLPGFDMEEQKRRFINR